MVEQAPTIPVPEFVRSPGLAVLGGIIRYRCPLKCGWHHDENPGRDAATESLSFVLPANWTSDDLSAALSDHAGKRQAAYLARVERAVLDHWAAAHPDVPVPARPDPQEHP